MHIIFRQNPQRLRHRLCQMVHFIGIIMQISHIRLPALVIKGAVRTAALQSGPEQKGELSFLSLFSCKKNFFMIGVHALIGMPVQIQQ